MTELVRCVMGLLLVVGVSTMAGCGGGASQADTGAAGGGAIAGTGGGAGGAGGGAVAGTGGGAAAAACRQGDSCTPDQSPCGACDKGVQRFCQCLTNTAGQAYWSCNSTLACGSANCGLQDTACNPRLHTRCENCDSSGARRACQCVPTASQGVWSCASTSGACGVSCGDRACLPGELCIRQGGYSGTLPDGGIQTVILTPYCRATPELCGTEPPSCRSCISAAFNCGPPGTCRDLGPETFECIIGGA